MLTKCMKRGKCTNYLHYVLTVKESATWNYKCMNNIMEVLESLKCHTRTINT